MKAIISTVGVSLFPVSLKKHPELDRFEDEIREAEREAWGKWHKLLPSDKGQVSAEIKSLEAIGVAREDLLHFLASDSVAGRLAAELTAVFCAERFGVECRDGVEVIEGMQVTDASRFQRQAVPAIIGRIYNLYEKYGGNLVLNPTGGFKAVVPYVTLVGLVFGLPVYYIYEKSDQLIRLPNSPLDFNLDMLTGLDTLAEDLVEDYLPKEELKERVGLSEDGVERLLEEGVLVEDYEDPSYVTLSPLGRLLHYRYQYRNTYTYLLSDEVKRKLSKPQYDVGVFTTIFRKMCDPVHLRIKEHKRFGGGKVDCHCYKMARRKERVFYYVEGRTVYICDIMNDHKEYDRIVNTTGVYRSSYTFSDRATTA